MELKHFGRFTDVLHLSDLEIARFIDTAVERIEQFKPAFVQLNRLVDQKEPMRILDFGCGVGRNTVGMLELSKKWIVTAYDNPNMIARGRKFYGERLQNDRLQMVSDWNEIIEDKTIEKNTFDAIFCCLVLQHIDQFQLRDYLADFAGLTNRLFVCGRRGLDEGWSDTGFIDVWLFIQENGFEAIELEKGLADGKNPNDHHYGIFAPKR